MKSRCGREKSIARIQQKQDTAATRDASVQGSACSGRQMAMYRSREKARIVNTLAYEELKQMYASEGVKITFTDNFEVDNRTPDRKCRRKRPFSATPENRKVLTKIFPCSAFYIVKVLISTKLLEDNQALKSSLFIIKTEIVSDCLVV